MYHKLFEDINKEENLYTQEKYDEFFKKSRATLACPHCDNLHHLTLHGSYTRNVYLSTDIRGEIVVKRLNCHTCRKTFVVLPPDIIPFKRYLSSVISQVIQTTHHYSTYLGEKILGLAKGVLDYWVKQFKKYHQALFLVKNSLALSAEEIPYWYQKIRPKWRFMQIISESTQAFHSFGTNHRVSSSLVKPSLVD